MPKTPQPEVARGNQLRVEVVAAGLVLATAKRSQQRTPQTAVGLRGKEHKLAVQFPGMTGGEPLIMQHARKFLTKRLLAFLRGSEQDRPTGVT